MWCSSCSVLHGSCLSNPKMYWMVNTFFLTYVLATPSRVVWHFTLSDRDAFRSSALSRSCIDSLSLVGDCPCTILWAMLAGCVCCLRTGVDSCFGITRSQRRTKCRRYCADHSHSLIHTSSTLDTFAPPTKTLFEYRRSKLNWPNRIKIHLRFALAACDSGHTSSIYVPHHCVSTNTVRF